jgi:hypothetical protein
MRGLRRHVGLFQQVFQTHHRHQRGVFEQGLPEVAQTGNRDAPSLWQAHQKKGLRWVQAQRAGGFQLPALQRHKAAAKYFRGVGPQHQRQRHHARKKRADIKRAVEVVIDEVGQPEVAHQHHQKLGHPAQHAGEHRHRTTQPGVAAELASRQHQAQHQPAHQGGAGQLHGHQRTLQQLARVGLQNIHLDSGKARPPPARGGGGLSVTC